MKKTLKQSAITKYFDDVEENFIESLPSGAGLDCPYEITCRKNGNTLVKSHFHAMTADGFYDGFMPFSFIVYPDMTISDVICNENKRASFYGLKEYLNEAFYNHFKYYMENYNIIESLETQWNEMLSKGIIPCIETEDDGEIYIEFQKENKRFISGGVCNIGILKDKEFPIEEGEDSLDYYLQGIIDAYNQ